MDGEKHTTPLTVSSFDEGEGEVFSEKMDDHSKKSTGAKNSAAAASRAKIQFYSELSDLLSEENLKPALRWQPRYQAIVINPEMFELLVLARSAAAPKFASFQRRLNRW